MHWVNIRGWTEQLRWPESLFGDLRTKSSHFIIQAMCDFLILSISMTVVALFSITPLLCNSWDIIKYVSHTMDHSSKCKPFIGQGRIAYNKVIKTWRCGLWIRQYEGEKGIMVRVSYGPSRSSKSQWWISMYFFSLFHPDTGKEMLFVFLRMCNFLLFIPFSNPPAESSSHQIEDLKGLWRQLWLPAEASSWCSGDSVRSGSKTNQFAGKERGYSKNPGKISTIQFHTAHPSSLLLSSL